MKKLFTFFVAICATTALWANGTEIDGICYILAGDSAEVTYFGSDSHSGEYVGDITIPATVTYEAQTYRVTSIGWRAFAYCDSLASITIPNSVTRIRENAFRWTYSLSSITIPSSVTSIEYEAFMGCSLTSIHVDAANTHYSSIDGVLFNYTKDTLIQYPIGSTRFSYTIPNSVTCIGENAFEWCSKLSSVSIPNSVKSIGYAAFRYCDSLTSITIPNSVTTIDSATFSYCYSLTSITIPNSVTSIGSYAFCGCYKFTSVNIPNSVTSIGKGAFERCSRLTTISIPYSVTSIGDRTFMNCDSLKSITCEAVNPPTCGSNYCFYNVNKSIPIYVPVGSISAYQDADQWKDFTNIKAITAQVVVVIEIESEPTSTSVEIAWPAVSGSDNYTIEVKQGSNVIRIVVFNTQGQLLTSTSNSPNRGHNCSNYAEETNIGWAYTINGLTPGTAYTYSVVSKDAGGNVLDTKNGSFETTSPTAIEEINDNRASSTDNRKLIKNGILLIERNGIYYNAQGAIVE